MIDFLINEFISILIYVTQFNQKPKTFEYFFKQSIKVTMHLQPGFHIAVELIFQYFDQHLSLGLYDTLTHGIDHHVDSGPNHSSSHQVFKLEIQFLVTDLSF